jgi:hypothetical protein
MSVAIFMMRKPQVVQTIMRATKIIRITTIMLLLGFDVFHIFGGDEPLELWLPFMKPLVG